MIQAMCWERVVTIDYFHDGPRHGVAFLDGKPHVYDSVFDEAEDEYSDEFELPPIDAALVPLIEERRRIQNNWALAFRAGETSLDNHPALPVDRGRYEELNAILDPLLATKSENAPRRIAEFRIIDTIDSEHDAEVRWSLPIDSK